jgi:hypothetical protein
MAEVVQESDKTRSATAPESARRRKLDELTNENYASERGAVRCIAWLGVRRGHKSRA